MTPTLSEVLQIETSKSELQPSALPTPLFSVEQVQAFEHDFAQRHQGSTYPLMQCAGKAAFQLMRELWPDGKHIVVVCGAGNNAGDGYIVALHAANAGLDVKVVEMVPQSQPKNDSALALELLKNNYPGVLGGQMADIAQGDVIVDALLGTGLGRPVSGSFLDVINKINAVDLPVLSLDIPSGLQADTGCALPTAVRADVTISFIGLKRGSVTGDAKTYCGLVYTNALMAARSEVDASAWWTLLDHKWPEWPRRSVNSHKGQSGHLGVVGGTKGMLGAVKMSACAALKLGAGLVSVGTHPDHTVVLNAAAPELMVFPLASTAEPFWRKPFRAFVVGPGLGQDSWAMEQWSKILSLNIPTVIDADALNLLAKKHQQRSNWVLTPHPGEAARLLDCSIEAIQNNRFVAAKKIVGRFGGVCVLKGAGTIVASRDTVWVLGHGNSAMASAGMGDVLSGAIGALLAMGLAPEKAALLGSLVHSASADQYVENEGSFGLVASELITAMPRLLNHFERIKG